MFFGFNYFFLPENLDYKHDEAIHYFRLFIYIIRKSNGFLSRYQDFLI